MGSGFRDVVDAARSSRALATLIERALESLTDPSHAEEIARRAFDMAPDDLDRRDPEQLALFIHGALAEAVEEVLGVGAIDTVCNYVERASGSLPALDPEQSGVMNRPSQVDEQDTLRTGPRPIVLLVSGNEWLRDEIDPWLSEAGYALVWCPEPDIVIAQCTTIQPQLAILDEDMPGLQRRKVVGLVKHALGKSAPPLVSVGRLTPESTKGLEAFLKCPLERNLFVAEINRAAAPPEGYEPPRPSPVPQGDDEAAKLSFFLDEAMSRLVAKPVHEAIVVDALARAGLATIPAAIAELTDFVVGPLRLAVRDALGEDLTEALLADLEPVIVQARESSGLQRRRDAPAACAPRPVGRARDVLVLANERAPRDSLSGALAARGHRVDEVDDAHAALDRCVEQRPDAVVVRLVGSVVRQRQFCALLALTLGESRPVVVVISETASANVPGADRVVATTLESGAVVEELDRLFDAQGR